LHDEGESDPPNFPGDFVRIDVRIDVRINVDEPRERGDA